jgi:antitoxin component YwqK of YwqJK toxin-antitoxin module
LPSGLEYQLVNLKLKNKNMEKQAQNLINLYNERGQKHGYWEEYLPGGQLFSKGHWVNGNRDGHWEFYHSNGQLMWKGRYVNRNRDGYWEDYYSNGQLWSKGRYVNGEREGDWEYYHCDGKLSSKGNWINGEFIKEKEQTELTMDEIAKKFGIPVEQLKIKK